MRSLERSLQSAELDPDVAVVVLGSSSPAFFSAGMDIKEAVTSDDTRTLLFDLQWMLETYSKPLIAALSGFVIGGGAEVALSADIRIGSPTTRFRFPGADYGFVQGSWHLIEIVGASWAREIVLTTREVLGEEARQLGLLHQIVNDPMDRALELARSISKKNELAIREGKRLIREAAGRSLEKRFRAERAVNDRQGNSEDLRRRLHDRFD
jgi:enoyl-CoA hydratase/carnithine racemase